MYEWFVQELSGRGFSVVLGILAGGLITWFVSHWRRYKQRQSILLGDARDTIVIHHHILEPVLTKEGTEPTAPGILHIRAIGQGELDRVVPNGHLASVLLHRAFQVTSHRTLISMEGAEGSFLLETLTNFVCDRVVNGNFEHDLYVMAPCCEPAELSVHQPITILLIAVKDLNLFENWSVCRNLLVEHGSDGSRVLTLMELAKRFRVEQAEIERRRKNGERIQWVETMYVLDLAIDKRTANLPSKPIPWGRFEPILKTMNLE